MSTRRPLAILVLDPRRHVAPIVAHSLGAAAAVEVVGDGAAALQLARRRRGRFDVAIADCLDQERHRADCMAFIAAVSVEFPWIAVVGVAGEGLGPEPIIRALRLGARDFLKRPVEAADITATIARVVRRRGWLPAPAEPAGVMRRIIAFLEQHYMHPLSLATLAKVAGCSRWHLCRMFRNVTGRPFRAFLTELRLERARELLLTSELSITEIAHEVGFYDLSHLDRAFRRRFGIRPGDLLGRRAGNADRPSSTRSGSGPRRPRKPSSRSEPSRGTRAGPR
jgi:AraC-like DNA-binding protein/CheY-like chemotaxis protein